MEIKTREAINRGNNLWIVGFLAIIATGLVALLFVEDEWVDRAEDLVFIVLAIAAVFWYHRGSNRFQFSLVPCGLLMVASLVKIAALVVEIGDLAAMGDDLLLLPPLFVMMIVAGTVLYRTRRAESLPDVDLARSR